MILFLFCHDKFRHIYKEFTYVSDQITQNLTALKQIQRIDANLHMFNPYSIDM
jgi:hypothetical protein